MLSDVPAEEFDGLLDACIADVLWEAEIANPPVDALVVADRLEVVVTHDQSMPHRARFAHLADRGGSGRGQATIVVGRAERPERAQWAVAHEIGESVVYRVFAGLDVRATEVSPETRERVASRLATRLLLPGRWFERDGPMLDWDLPALKARYATASHELIARRMLEMRPGVVMTVCDLGSVHWRRSNVSSRVRPMLTAERAVWQRSHMTAVPADAILDPEATGLQRVRCWPIHEPGWKREILRSDVADW